MADIKMNFNTEVANKVGTDAAIILANIEFWQMTNKANNRNFKNGHYWTYNSVRAYEEIFDYLSSQQIRRCLDKLEKAGYIISNNFNESGYDRTKWYCSIRKMHLSKSTNGIVENDKPIPNSKTNNNPNNKNSSAKPNGFSEIDFSSEYDSFKQQDEKRKKVPPKKETEDEVVEAELWPTFDDFWELYDKKKDKKKCVTKWAKIKQSDKELIMQHVPMYLQTISEKQYQKFPYTYLNGECWNDEISVNDVKKSAQDKQLETIQKNIQAFGL